MTRAVLKIGNCVLAEKAPHRRSDWASSPELMRIREIERLIRDRHGRIVPDPEDTDDRDTCLAYVKAAAYSLVQRDMSNWCARWAPWVREAEIVGIEASASKRRRMMTADGVAGLLCVTLAERTKLGLKTIGACDVTKEERAKFAKDRKRDRDRRRQEGKRREAGRQNRNSHAGQTLAATKPWKEAGISRATWYRRRETEVSRIDIYTKGDTRVSRANYGPVAQPSPAVSKPIADGVAGRREGPGDHPPAEFQEAEPHGSGDWFSKDAA